MCIRDRYIACLDPIGKLQGEKEFSLTPELYGNFLIELFELWEIDLKQGKQPYIRQFENYISILLGYMPVSYTHLDVYKRQVSDRAGAEE